MKTVSFSRADLLEKIQYLNRVILLDAKLSLDLTSISRKIYQIDVFSANERQTLGTGSINELWKPLEAFEKGFIAGWNGRKKP